MKTSKSAARDNSAGLAAEALRKKRATIQKLEKGKAEALRLILEHDGLYPGNGGRLSQAELCRLAGVDPSLLGQPAHRSTTRVDLNDWLRKIRRDMVTGKHRVRREVTGRVEQWKTAYNELLTSFSIVELELENANRVIQALQSQVRDLGGTPAE
ncbi:hypothetical protein LJR009_002307 [Bosea sp. LjRoot9]|uniref:hypothetical protein n=1 Tax=Bosea sp. LjRoot9 TaxID=3342341 RepID=UPI003ECD9AA4